MKNHKNYLVERVIEVCKEVIWSSESTAEQINQSIDLLEEVQAQHTGYVQQILELKQCALEMLEGMGEL